MKRITILAIVMVLVLSGFVFAQPVMADSDTFYSSSSDGFLGYNDDFYDDERDWATVRDAATAEYKYTASTTLEVFTQHAGNQYEVDRAFLYFDTSSIPDDAVVTVARLYLYAQATVYDDDNAEVYIVSGMPTYPTDPLELTDYDYNLYDFSTTYGWLDVGTDWAASQYNLVNARDTSALPALINKTGTTKLVLIERRDKENEVPADNTGNAIFAWSSEKGAGYQPYLYVEWEDVLGDCANLVAIPGSTSNSLSWARATASTYSVVRYSTTDYPATPTSGAAAYNGTSTSYVHTGLIAGRTYYYAVWGWDGTDYSTNAATAMVTTGAGVADSDPLPTPTAPSRWLSAPDYTNLSNLLVVYDAVNDTADVLGMPRETAWMGLALLLSIAIGIALYAISKSIVVGTIAMVAGMIFGWVIMLVPFWIPLMAIILVITLKVTQREVSY